MVWLLFNSRSVMRFFAFSVAGLWALWSSITLGSSGLDQQLTRSINGEEKVLVTAFYRDSSRDNLRAPLNSAELHSVVDAQRSIIEKFTVQSSDIVHQYHAIPAMTFWLSAERLSQLTEAQSGSRLQPLSPQSSILVSPEISGALPTPRPTRSGGGDLVDTLSIIGADTMHELGFTGEGSRIAVLDSGLDLDNSDFGQRIIAEACFCYNPNGNCCPSGGSTQFGSGSAEDDHGHGTHVAGICAANDSNVGVAPDTELVAVKTLSESNGFYSFSDQTAALDWLYSQDLRLTTVNMSLATYARFTGICDNTAAWMQAAFVAIENLKSQGTRVVVAAGNDGAIDSLPVPACLSNVVTIGATNDSDVIASFSNSTPLVDLLAPGVSVKSSAVGGESVFLSGTSMATPHVAGGLALLRGAAPEYVSWDTILSVLASNSTLVTDNNGADVPRIDLDLAYSVLQNIQSFTVTPSLIGNGSITPDSALIIEDGGQLKFTLMPDVGHEISSVQGTCGGELSGPQFTTIPVTQNCTIEAVFVPESDTDGDGIPDNSDNCPSVSNVGQKDADFDGVGNACDDDDDGDSILDASDNCSLTFNPNQTNSDADSLGDACDVFPMQDIGDFLDANNNGAPEACDTTCEALGMSRDATPIALPVYASSLSNSSELTNSALVLLEATDQEFDSLTFEITAEPEFGHLVDARSNLEVPMNQALAGPAVRYVPDAGSKLQDSFEYRVSDGAGVSAVQTANLTVYDAYRESAVLTVQIESADPGEREGMATAMSSKGDIIALGATYGGIDQSGSVRVMKELEGEWVQMGAKIEGSAPRDLFGRQLALSADGGTLAASAVEKYVRIFSWDGTSWTQLGNELSSDSSSNLFGFGLALSKDGKTLAVGSPFNDDTGADAGRVIVYRLTDGEWVPLGSQLFGGGAQDNFGWYIDLAADGTRLAVYSLYATPRVVTVFDFDGNDWRQLGNSIPISLAQKVILSSDGESLGVGSNVYGLNQSSWESVGDDVTTGEITAMSADASVVAVTENNYPSPDNVVRLYSLAESGWQLLGEEFSGEPTNFFGSNVELSSDGQILSISESHASTTRVYDIINLAPVVDAAAPASFAIENKPYEFKLSAVDPDPSDSLLSYVAVSVPNWLSIDNEDGTVFGTPDSRSVGLSQFIEVGASDGELISLLAKFRIEVLRDSDGDGLPNECNKVCISEGNIPDPDDDNDGVTDDLDAFPLDPTETKDSDGDGFGDNLEIAEDTDPFDANDQPYQPRFPRWLILQSRELEFRAP